jgi:hypothetical protein
VKKGPLLAAVSMVALTGYLAGPSGAVMLMGVDPAEMSAYRAATTDAPPGASRLPLKRWQPAPHQEPALLVAYDDDHGGSTVNTPTQQQPPPAQQPQQGNTTQAQRTLQAVEKASGRLNSDISRCNLNDPIEQVADCLGLALSYYANSLSSPKVVLSAELKAIPRIVVRTARAVRTASTARRAQEAVQQAIQEIRKQVQLLQVADDSAAAKLQVRAGNLVAASLDNLSDKLRQVEL